MRVMSARSRLLRTVPAPGVVRSDLRAALTVGGAMEHSVTQSGLGAAVVIHPLDRGCIDIDRIRAAVRAQKGVRWRIEARPLEAGPGHSAFPRRVVPCGKRQAYRHLVGHIAARAIAVTGDSAGGNLTALVLAGERRWRRSTTRWSPPRQSDPPIAPLYRAGLHSARSRSSINAESPNGSSSTGDEIMQVGGVRASTPSDISGLSPTRAQCYNGLGGALWRQGTVEGPAIPCRLGARLGRADHRGRE